MTRVLVTGASGFVGRHLCAALGREGSDVVPLSRSGTGHVRADVTEPGTLAGVADGCQAAVHLASLVVGPGAGRNGPDERDFERVVVLGTRNVLEECIRAGVRDFVYVSSVKALAGESAGALDEDAPPRPEGAYGRSKLQAEALVRELCAAAGVRAIIVRPPAVYGPGGRGNVNRLLGLVRRGVPLPLAALHNRRSIVFVGNLVSAIIALLRARTDAGLAFHVADPEPVSTAALVRLMGEVTRRPARLVPVPESLLRAAGRMGDAVGRLVPVPLTTAEVTKLAGSLVLDTRRLAAVGGYTPGIDTRAGLEITCTSPN